MVRVRKLVLAIAAASTLTSGMAQALGLGEVTLQSTLNQPLVAEIELLEVRDLTASEVASHLASPEAFNKAGVDRQYFLTDLKFTPVLKPNGKSVLRVTSSKPVREPYLNFLVEVLWPNGRLLREYTLLLDPPLYNPQPVVASAPRMPVAAPSSAPVRSVAPRAAAPTPMAAAPVSSSTATSTAAPAAALRGEEYKTSSSDTLWEIARRVPGGSVHQTMLAIQDLNPDAFIGGNINRMKSGQVLRLPDEQKIRSRSQAEAIAQVAEQNGAWREGRSVAASTPQLDATKRSTAGAAPAQTEATDNLRLVAADSGKSTRGSENGSGSATSKALSDKLAVTQESLDSTRRENSELKGRMGDLESQLDKLQRLIQLKDDQLAKLQADLAAQGQQPAAVTPTETPVSAAPVVPAPVAAAEPAQTAEPAPAAEAEPAQAASPTEDAAGQPEANGVSAAPAPATPPDYNYAEEPAATADPQASNQEPAEEPAVAVQPVAEAPAAVEAEPQTAAVAAPEAPSEGFLEEIMKDSTLMAVIGGGALLLLLIILMLLSRRNAMKEAELHQNLIVPGADGTFDTTDDSGFEGLAVADEAAAEAAAEERVAAQTGDALGEADIYIAYGRFNQAAELLQSAIDEEPQRSDLRLKLMEVHAELGDRDGFARQENELREIGGAGAEIDQLKARYPAMASLAAAGFAGAAVADTLDDFDLDDLDLDEPTDATTAADAELDDSFDLSLDDLEADLDRDLQASTGRSTLVDTDFADLNLDDDLDLSIADSKPSSDLDFNFDMDSAGAPATLEDEDPLADLDLDAPATGASTAVEDEFLLDLDAENSEPELDLPADFDLSLADDEPAATQSTSDSFLAELDDVNSELDQLSESIAASADNPFATPQAPEVTAGGADPDDDDFDFLSGTDETATKLDLARAYIDMGDTEGARDILDEVISEGNDVQQSEARDLLASLV